MEEDIAEKLRLENPEQFLTLVRMHLSFIIDMNTDENDSTVDKPKSFKWGFSKKIKCVESGNKGISGPTKITEIYPLTDDNINQIYHLIDILSADNNVCQEGIFRRTGSLSRQQQLRLMLLSGGKINDENSKREHAFNVHDMASVLKGILADTPEPLLLHQHYQAYSHLANTYFTDDKIICNSESRVIGALRLLLLLVPAPSRRLANRLLLLLHQTASHENSNRMSPSALATMFTPHVMCPRKSSPEALHTDSQILAPVLSFMISKAPVLFITPPQLATDIVTYFTRKEQKRLLSPKGEDLNESVSEKTAANTVFTFVDRQMSGINDTTDKNGNKNNSSNATFTDTALAQLYAHIQALPESQNKRRLIKQFNRENGHGTPLQLQRIQKQKSNGQSLKKLIFNKSLINKTSKKLSLVQDSGFGYQSISESPTLKMCMKNDLTLPSNVSNTEENQAINKMSLSTDGDIDCVDKAQLPSIVVETKQLSTTPHIRRKLESNLLLTSTPQISHIMNSDIVGSCSTPILPNNRVQRGSMSPITKSAQAMPKSMQESIMTPRSRKPVIINCDPTIAPPSTAQESVIMQNNSYNSNCSYDSLSSSIKNDSDFVSTDESHTFNSCFIKYKRFSDNDISKTESTKSKPFAYENSHASATEKIHNDRDKSNSSINRVYNLDQTDNELIHRKLLEVSSTRSDCEETSENLCLTNAFQNYLLCRSILTKSPVDLSFANEPEDLNNIHSEDINMSENKISESMLFCLNGNRPLNISNFSRESDTEFLLKNNEESHTDSHNKNENEKNEDVKQGLNCDTPKCTNKENISPGSKRAVFISEHNNIKPKKINLCKSSNENCDLPNLVEMCTEYFNKENRNISAQETQL